MDAEDYLYLGRAVAIVAHACAAPNADLFGAWEDMSAETKAELDARGPIPCEGSGQPGPWCAECRFGQLELLSGAQADA